MSNCKSILCNEVADLKVDDGVLYYKCRECGVRFTTSTINDAILILKGDFKIIKK